jgi:hypothetical protein
MCQVRLRTNPTFGSTAMYLQCPLQGSKTQPTSGRSKCRHECNPKRNNPLRQQSTQTFKSNMISMQVLS